MTIDENAPDYICIIGTLGKNARIESSKRVTLNEVKKIMRKLLDINYPIFYNTAEDYYDFEDVFTELYWTLDMTHIFGLTIELQKQVIGDLFMICCDTTLNFKPLKI